MPAPSPRSDSITAAKLIAQLTTEPTAQFTVGQPNAKLRAAYRRALHAAHSHPDLPPGMRLRYSGRDAGDMNFRLEPASQPIIANPPPTVPIPQRIYRPHPAVSALRTHRKDRNGWIDTRRTPGVANVAISSSQLQRSIKLLHAITTEAERRGYTITDHYTRYSQAADGLFIVIADHPVEVAIREEQRQIRRPVHDSTWRTSTVDLEPTGRLELQEGLNSSGVRTLATDRKRWRIEDRLGHAFVKLEERAEHYRQAYEQGLVEQARRLQQQQEQAERRQAEALHQAKVDHLQLQLQHYHQAQAIRDLLQQLDSSATQASDPDWLSWVAAYADQIDPSRTGLQGPNLDRVTSRPALGPRQLSQLPSTMG